MFHRQLLLTHAPSGFLLKDAGRDQLIAAVEAVARGDALIAPSVTRRLIERFVARSPAPTPPDVDELTPRELDVLHLIARGRSNAELAADLTISETTAKTHVARILGKLRLRDRVQIVVFAYEHGFVQPGEHTTARTPSQRAPTHTRAKLPP